MRQTNVRASVSAVVLALLVIVAQAPGSSAQNDPTGELSRITSQQHRSPFPNNTVDTTSLSVQHADDFLRIKIPSIDILVPSDSFRAIHPSGLYYPNGFLGWKRWLVLTRGSDYLEDPFIRVSNDGENWYRFGVGKDSCPDPLFTVADCPRNGAPAGHLSDGELYRTRDSTLWVIWRASYAPVASDMGWNALYASSTRDGITWSRPIQIVPFTKGDASLISPAVWRSPAGGYRMWTVEPPEPEAVNGTTGSTILLLWHADSIGMQWTVVDTVRQAGTLNAWPGSDQLSGRDSAWHVEVVPNGRTERLVLLTAMNGYTHPLYIGKSTDDGTSVDFKYAPLLSGRGDGTSWDSRDVYRSTGYWVNKDGETVLELIYSGMSEAGPGSWRVGRTDVHFHALGPVSILSPADTNNLTVFNLRPTFAWTPAAAPDSSDTVLYRLEVSTSPDLSNATVKDSLTTTQYTLDASLRPGTQYYWRLSDWDGLGRQSVNPDEGQLSTWVSGDINLSRVTDLGDLSALVAYLTGGPWTSPAPHLVADDNGDCHVDLADLSRLVAYLTSVGIQLLPGCGN